MASLVIKNLPKPLHKKLKEMALSHHRSMNKEIVVLLEAAVAQSAAVKEFGSPLKGKFPLTQKFIDMAKSQGRA